MSIEAASVLSHVLPAAPPMAMPIRRGQRILLVEDDERQRAITGRLLCEAGHEPVTAGSASEAMSRLDETIGLLVSDIDLGAGPDGLTLADRAKARFPDLPLLIVSGQSAEALRKRGLARTHFLRKPFTASALLEMIDTLCDR